MLEKIKEIIVDKMDMDASLITEEASFENDLKIDSLDLFDLVMSFEESFGVEIPPEDLEGIKTVGDMMNYLKGKGIED